MGAKVMLIYSDAEKIIFTSHPEPIVLETQDDMVAYFDQCIRYWRLHCRGEKVFVVVEYENLTTNLDELDFYASQVKRVMNECAITIVRYKGGLVQRMAGRGTAVRLHAPSNMYASRSEAINVVRGLRRGTILPSPP
jgi:hypothetical protein